MLRQSRRPAANLGECDVDHKAILEKVKGLIAKAQGGTTEEEAATCMRLAHSLLEKYNLSMSDLPSEEQDNAVEGQNLDEMYMTPWRNTIFSAAVSLYFCDGFHSQWFDQVNYRAKYETWEKEWDAFCKGDDYFNESERRAMWKKQPDTRTYFRPRLVIVGRPHNRAVCMEMIPYLYKTVMRLAREYAKTLSDADLAMQGISRRKAQLDFEYGCGERVASRLWTMAYEAKLAMRKAQQKGTGTSLTIYDQMEKENEAFMETQKLKKRGGGSKGVDSEHADAGDAAGQSVSLAPQVGQGAASKAHALPAPPKALPSR